MRHEITVSIAPTADTRKESASLALHFPGQSAEVNLDVDGNALLRVSRTVPDIAQDFLTIASCIYAADKAVPRASEDDRWTRHMAIEIPVEHVVTWGAVAADIEECIGFLTGDRWEISFRHSEMRLIQKKARKYWVRERPPKGAAVSLLSGGLDSFIGAVDWLTSNPGAPLLLVAHYDGDVGGPGQDQRSVGESCLRRFGDQFEMAQTRIGLATGSTDTSFRSRSLLFIALGCYFAEILGANTPVLIPENGPIALNYPLTPARRGSCSTRTVHPHFIAGINRVLARVGSLSPVQNPYELKTKGEMVSGCLDQDFLEGTFVLTRSCAKFGHRRHWVDRTARSCGICIPCLFRRASLHASGRDTERYGVKIESFATNSDTPSDLRALVTFLKKNPSDRDIARTLLGNGPFQSDQMVPYVDLIKRMRAEVLVWLRARGSPYLIGEVAGC
jgi:hypothetical protein